MEPAGHYAALNKAAVTKSLEIESLRLDRHFESLNLHLLQSAHWNHRTGLTSVYSNRVLDVY